MPELREAWIELVEELRRRAPVSAAMIKPSVNDSRRLVDELGVVDADDLVTWFALHDGAGWSLGGGQLLGDNLVLGLDDVIATRTTLRDTWADEEPGQTENTGGDVDIAGEVVGTWLDRYVMVGSDTLGGGWFVDLRPGPLHGCVRYWDKVGADDVNATGWPGLTQLLRAVTSAVRDGTAVDGYLAHVVDGALEWDDEPAR